MIRRHSQRLYRVIRPHVVDESDAEEALQLAHIRAWQALSQFERRSSYLTWMTRIAIREAHALAAKRERGREIELGAAETSERGADPFAHEADRSELRLLLEHAIQSLPAAYRTVFVLREVEGMSTEEVARDLELTESATKVRLMRAREKLRALLLAQAGDHECIQSVWRFGTSRCDAVTAATLAAIRGTDAIFVTFEP